MQVVAQQEFCAIRIIARADVVHCHQLHTFLADQCVLLGRVLRKPVFLTDHAGGDRHFNRRLRTVEGAAGLLLVSDFNARGFKAHAHKIRIILGGVFLVWTGLTLAWRRLRAWRGRRATSAAVG